MRLRRRTSRGASLAVMASALCGAPADAALDADGRDPAALAAVAGMVNASRSACGLRVVDTPSAQVATTPVDLLDTFPSTPLGAQRVELRVTDAVGNPVTTHWYVPPGGRPRPLNPSAARLAAGCRAGSDDAPVTALDWHELPYLDMEGGTFSVDSSSAWRGSTVAPYFPDRGNHALDDPRQVLWGSTCSAASKTVTLRRTVYLPGVPSQAGVAMLPYTRLAGREATVTGMAIALNGRTIASTTKSILTADLPPATLARFRSGANELVVTLRKRRSARCNRTAADALGVIFRLSGSYANDVTVVPPPATTANGGGPATFTLTMTNQGPSTWIEPRIFFQISSSDTAGVTMADLDGGTGQACLTKDGDITRVLCTLAPMPAGTATKATFTFGVLRPESRPAPYVAHFTLSWRARGLNDPTQDAVTSREGTICFPSAAKPKCEGL